MTMHRRRPVASRGMSVLDLATMLSVHSLDLRAEYEAKLRILTEIQREIEALRAAAATSAQHQRALDSLEKWFNELAAANRDASETLAMIRDEFEQVRQPAAKTVRKR